MPIVTVKNKYQIVIPRAVREQIGVNVGDLLEAKVERGKITFTPKALVERGLLESLADYKQGRAYGPFRSEDELATSLQRESRRLRVRKPKDAA